MWKKGQAGGVEQKVDKCADRIARQPADSGLSLSWCNCWPLSRVHVRTYVYVNI